MSPINVDGSCCLTEGILITKNINEELLMFGFVGFQSNEAVSITISDDQDDIQLPINYTREIGS